LSDMNAATILEVTKEINAISLSMKTKLELMRHEQAELTSIATGFEEGTSESQLMLKDLENEEKSLQEILNGETSDRKLLLAEIRELDSANQDHQLRIEQLKALVTKLELENQVLLGGASRSTVDQ
jgi:hypothetical protein